MTQLLWIFSQDIPRNLDLIEISIFMTINKLKSNYYDDDYCGIRGITADGSGDYGRG